MLLGVQTYHCLFQSLVSLLKRFKSSPNAQEYCSFSRRNWNLRREVQEGLGLVQVVLMKSLSSTKLVLATHAN